jgi:ribosomal protein uL13
MIIDGKNTVLGRLASYVAKEALKGEEIIVVNCNKIIISGSRKNLVEEFQQKRKRVGFSQKGPKYSKDSEKIVKRTIRGMLPDHREGRGRVAFKKIKCYQEIPEKYLESKKISLNTGDKNKFIEVQEIFK